MPTISVIVPVYKVEAYLDRCVQSILDQTYTDYELILVDDGSPDNCGAMCDAWAEKDTRIRVIHKGNGGLSDARNVGFEASTGEWITFIDSDDYIHPKMLEALYSAVMELDVKVSICGYADTTGEPLEATDFTAKLWKPEDFYIQHNVNATVAWGKLYNRSTVLTYPKGKLHEDEYVTYQILFAFDKVAVIASALYGYYSNPSSIIRREWSPKRMDIFPAIERQVCFFGELGLSELCYSRAHLYLFSAVIMLSEIEKHGKNDIYSSERKKIAKMGKRFIRKYHKLFQIDKDGWLIFRFSPGWHWVWYYSLIAFRKIGLRK